MNISIPRVLDKLDAYLRKNQYQAADRHLRYWLTEADALGDSRSAFAILNEMIGLYRKCGMQEECVSACERTLSMIGDAGLADTVSAATAYINVATAYKNFGMSERALPLYEMAKEIYERDVEDARLAGLYNNMALALADTGRLAEAEELYERALSILKEQNGSEPERAITCLNMADLINLRDGALGAEAATQELLCAADALLETAWEEGYEDYAFVAEKCAPVFRHYGSFLIAAKLEKRMEEMRKGTE